MNGDDADNSYEKSKMSTAASSPSIKFKDANIDREVEEFKQRLENFSISKNRA